MYKIMIHPSTEVKSIGGEKGYGLFATSLIPKGTITWARDQLDREITPEQLLQYNQRIRETILHFSYRNSQGNFIFCWDNTRYINHDCNPNCCLTAYDIEIAVRDIQPGEEITNHYGMLNIIEPFTVPGLEDTVIQPDDLLRYGRTWDSMAEDAIHFLNQVEQPLRNLISDKRWNELCELIDGKRAIQSITTCYYTGCPQMKST